MRQQRPIQQKQTGKHNAGYAIGSHKGEIYTAQIVRFNQQVLIGKHDAKK